ncbi:MAG TPA: protein-L-isoaspartate(D-aspartate) O-methyltransferase [Aggregatilineales bacterium]|nr:protein-L-isoaspartate(D-aspartate) O-methyltransferase [Aggregatilineales bacterium]
MTTLDFYNLRKRMVQEQLEARNIVDPRVLMAMADVPRHIFVPDELRHMAYHDGPLSIGQDQTISQPFIVAYMSQCLQLSGHENVLEIGTGSGYHTAILCQLAAHVTSIERNSILAERAAQNLDELGISNVEIYEGDGSQGMPDMAPYDAIVASAAVPAVPTMLRAQLGESGTLIMPVGDNHFQYLERTIRTGMTWHVEQIIPVMFVLMIGRYGFGPRATGSAAQL